MFGEKYEGCCLISLVHVNHFSPNKVIHSFFYFSYLYKFQIFEKEVKIFVQVYY